MTMTLPMSVARGRARLAVPALLLTTVAALLALGPLVVQHDPTAQTLLDMLEGPSAQHWLGSDHLGSDVAARLVHGVRSLGIALLCVTVATGVGTLLGLQPPTPEWGAMISELLDPPVQRETIALLRDIVAADDLGLMLIGHDRALLNATADEAIELGGKGWPTTAGQAP